MRQRSFLPPSAAAAAAALLALLVPPWAAPAAGSAGREIRPLERSSGPAWAAATIDDDGLRAYASLPLAFEPLGRDAAGADFLARGAGYAVLLTSSGATVVLHGGEGAAARVRLELVGAGSAAPRALERLPGRSHSLVGSDPRGWRLDVPLFARVAYERVWPGVDVLYRGDQRRLEYDFVVAPGADPDAIRIRFAGVEGVRLDEATLVLETTAGDLRQDAPLLYQDVGGDRRTVSGGWRLAEDGSVGFHVGAYDAALPLVIDPVVVYSSFLGGAGVETDGQLELVEGVAYDGAGNAYVVGQSYSPPSSFPITPGSHDETLGGSKDAFVAKLDADGDLVYSTYLGGGNTDHGRAIAVDRFGQAYVTGTTRSTNFPTLNPFPGGAGLGGGTGGFADAFVTKLNAAGSGLVYSSYLGGDVDDVAQGIAVDPAGQAYVTGYTEGDGFDVANAMFATYQGGTRDGFVTKIAASGSSLVYSTFYGGSGRDTGYSIVASPSGEAWLVGNTQSLDFPTAGSASALSGTRDAFVARLNATGSTRVFSRYLGGLGAEFGFGIDVDPSGSAYVTGSTTSGNFPGTTGRFQPSRGGGANDTDGFVAKLGGDGALAFATYLGGAAFDEGLDVAVDLCGRLYVVGNTQSGGLPSGNFPQSLPVELYNGGMDAFVAVLNPEMTVLSFSTFWGGTAGDGATGVAAQGCIEWAYVGGFTGGGIPTVNAFDGSYGGGSADGFVAKLDVGTDVDDDQAPDLVEVEEGMNVNAKDNDVFTSPRLFAMQQYRDFLGREGDPGGITYWTDRIQAGESRASVVENFFLSTEFQSTTAPVTRLYFAFFLRIPDYAGLTYWIEELRRGVPLSVISESFVLSTEFQTTYGAVDDSTFIELVYENVLGRDPDPGGFEFWSDQLASGLTRGAMMVSFSESDEYKALIFNEVYVVQIYVGMLERAPEQGGFDFWVGEMDGGASGRNLIQSFLAAPEYENRFLP